MAFRMQPDSGSQNSGESGSLLTANGKAKPAQWIVTPTSEQTTNAARVSRPALRCRSLKTGRFGEAGSSFRHYEVKSSLFTRFVGRNINRQNSTKNAQIELKTVPWCYLFCIRK
jgi:hypothetical protein